MYRPTISSAIRVYASRHAGVMSHITGSTYAVSWRSKRTSEHIGGVLRRSHQGCGSPALLQSSAVVAFSQMWRSQPRARPLRR